MLINEWLNFYAKPITLHEYKSFCNNLMPATSSEGHRKNLSRETISEVSYYSQTNTVLGSIIPEN